MNKKRKEFFSLALLISSWKAFLFLISYVATFVLEYKPSFPYYKDLALYGFKPWIYSWANFDGVHYLTIARKGYFGTGLIQAFFPVYPLLVKNLNIFDNLLLTGLLISNLFSIIFIILFYFFLKEFFNHQKSLLIIAIFMLFPTSFFLGSFYTESIFLSMVVGSFLAAHKKKWWLAGILAALASATRVVGIILVPALLVEFFFPFEFSLQKIRAINFKEKIWSLRKLINLSWIGAGSLGLLFYMFYLNKTYYDPLYFFHVQDEFGGIRQENLILYPQVVWRSLKILWTARPFDFKYLAYFQEFLTGTLGLALILWGFVKKIKLSYLVFALGVFLVPPLTGTFSSMPRYILVCFPIFIVLADLLKNKKTLWTYLTISGILLIINTILFIQGYWVA
jgi:hypothetical protein